MLKKFNMSLITIALTLTTLFSCNNVAYAQTYNTATGTVTGSGVSALYPDSCKTDQHKEMDSGWSAEDKAFTHNHDNFGWLGSGASQSSSYTFANNSTRITNAVYYVSIRDLSSIRNADTIRFLKTNDIHIFAGMSSTPQISHNFDFNKISFFT